MKNSCFAFCNAFSKQKSGHSEIRESTITLRTPHNQLSLTNENRCECFVPILKSMWAKADADGNNTEANEAIEADADETDEVDKANEAADEAEAD